MISLRVRLTASWMAILTFLATASWVAIVFSNQRSAEAYAASALASVVSELDEEMDPKLSFEDDYFELVEELEEEAIHLSERLLLLRVAAGRIVDSSDLTVAQPGDPIPDLRAEWLLEELSFRGQTLLVGFFFRDRQEQLERQAAQLALLGFGAVVLTSLGCWVLVGLSLSPIEKLTRQARTTRSPGLESRLRPPSRDRELLDLVDTLNSFLDGLAKAAEDRSRFYASASHELRTPLQALSGHLDLALSQPRSEREYRETIQEAQAQTRRLIRLTQDLLTLNRLEQRADIRREAVDLAELCEQVWSGLEARAQSRRLEVDLELPERWSIDGSTTLLTMLLQNLFENAVKYTPEGGRVRIALDPIRRALLVTNSSPFILEADLVRLCEPFFRPDPSRESRTGGNGLGLPIARSIIEHLQWAMTLAYGDGEFAVEVRVEPRKALS